MGILGTALTLSAAGATACYSPDLRDCTLRCNEVADCAADQVCGSDHFCAAPEIAGQCSALPFDAGTDGRDARIPDATLPDATPDAPPDGPMLAALSIHIDGKGQVTVPMVGTCDEHDHGCVLLVPLDATVTAQATADPDWRFARWTTPACDDDTDDPTCTITASGPMTIGAKFRKGDD